MIHSYFIAGTDTGVGKTLVSAALLHKASQQGYATFGLKPVAAGCLGTPPTNSDALLLQRHSSQKLDYEWHNPVALKAAIAPHIAAEQENCSKLLELDALVQSCHNSLTKARQASGGSNTWQLIEGAGGWLVPLNRQHTLADLALSLSTPVILVVGLRLGCINHALLSAQAIQTKGLKLVGWVANSLSSDMKAEASNLEFLTQHFQQIGIQCLGAIPYQAELDFEESETRHQLPGTSIIAQVAQKLTLPGQPDSRTAVSRMHPDNRQGSQTQYT